MRLANGTIVRQAGTTNLYEVVDYVLREGFAAHYRADILPGERGPPHLFFTEAALKDGSAIIFQRPPRRRGLIL